MRRYGFLALAVTVALAALLLASPATLTVSLANFPCNFTSFWVYSEAGGLAASGSVSGNGFSFEYDRSASYIAKAEGDKAVAVFTVPSGVTGTQYTVTPADLAQANVTIVFIGPGYKPSVVAYTVAVPPYPNMTATSGKLLYTSAPAVLKFPETLMFPAVYGYKLVSVKVDGTEVTQVTLDAAGRVYNVEVTYEAAGLAAVEPALLLAVVAVVIIIIAALAVMRRRGVQSAVVALRSPYLEG
ncbi:MAG: hypothetical protein QXW41_07560 [Fervidicoccaceae archaeon]